MTFVKGGTPWNKGTVGNTRSGVPWNKGKTGVYTPETLLKMSTPKGLEHSERLSVLMKGRFTGNKNQFWQGGSIKYFKRLALERDKYTCQKCGCAEKDILHVDHIKPKAIHPELFKVLDNLMTLCPNCHERKSRADKRFIYSLKAAKIYGK